MQVAIALFPGNTALDAVGPLRVLQRVPSFDVVFVGHRRGEVRSDNAMLGLLCDAAFDELTRPDVVIFPGGIGTRTLIHDQTVLDWVREAHRHTLLTTSVCTGGLVLAAAGLLNGLTATTHWRVQDLFNSLGARYVPSVSSSICQSGSSPPPGCRAGSTWDCGWWSFWSAGKPPKRAS